MSDFPLPAGFEELAGYRAWGLRTEQERSDRRQASTVADIEEFYRVMTARIEEIFAHLNALPLAGLAPADENLLLLTLSLQEISTVVENYRTVAVPDGWDVRDIEMNVVGGTY
ncbi:MAG TPA: hypothetical protein VL595_17180 [Pseudonocardia sp.]|jgi:hypothetical protein|nr:hypothetical protein [Pseudonocardia sp.]